MDKHVITLPKSGRFIVYVNDKGCRIKDADDYVILRKEKVEKSQAQIKEARKMLARASQNIA